MTSKLLLALLLGATGAQAATVVERELARPEGPRHYLAMAPAAQGEEKLPAVILLHGHGASAAIMLGMAKIGGYRVDDWSRLAQREHLLLLAPDGIKASDDKRAWNDCRADASTNATSDDVGFIGALIDTAIREHHAHPRRIYVFGSSNGGGMAYRLAIELGPRLAAVGVQSALMAAKSRCAAPTHPLPMFFVHGTSDKISPWAGGEVGHWTLRGRGSGLSVDQSVELWRNLARLPAAPAVYTVPHRVESDPTSVTRYLWSGAPGQAKVELLKVEGGGHTMPSLGEEMPWLLRQMVGAMNRDLDTAAEAWAFFKDKRATPAAAPSYP